MERSEGTLGAAGATPHFGRRAFLRALLGLGSVAAIPFLAPLSPAPSGSGVPRVEGFPPPHRDLFADHEQVLARYLMSAGPMANDIVMRGSQRGFMGGGWWRPAWARSPTNARIMEHVATLAWFYANERPWNRPGHELFGDAALLSRLELAVGYYTGLQLPDGSYPEYDGKSSLAATTFGMVAQAHTLEALQAAGVSRPSQTGLSSSMKRSVTWFMNPRAAHWQTPIRAFNQVAAGLVGVLRSLQVLGEAGVSRDQIDERITYLCKHGVAPAGFMHEPYGVDFSYNFDVAMPDLAWLHTHTAHPDLVPLVRRYMQFMRYALIPEPDGRHLSHVPALHNRNVTSALERPVADLRDRAALAKAFLKEVPEIAVFLPTAEEKSEARNAFRAGREPIAPLDKPHTSPRTWMYGTLAPEGPTGEQRRSVEDNLPVVTSRRFTRLDDGSKGDLYLFVGRPEYYTVGVFGLHPHGLSTRQLGTLWGARMGTVLVGTNDPEAAEGWDTVGPNGDFSTRRSSSRSTFFDGRDARAPGLSPEDVGQTTGLFAQRTASSPDAGEYATAWRYWDAGVGFTFFSARGGRCTQVLPVLMKPGDRLVFSDGTEFIEGDSEASVDARSIVLARGGSNALFSFGPQARPARVSRSSARIAGGVIHRVEIDFERQIDVQIGFVDGVSAEPLSAEAHTDGRGALAVRVVLFVTGRGSIDHVRFVGIGGELDSTIEMAESASGWQVVERTLTPPAVPSALIVETYDSRARRRSRIRIAVRSRR